MQAPDLGAHVEAQRGVLVGQRLVHQHQRGLGGDRAGDGDALLLAARQLAGQLLGVLLELDQRDGLLDPRRDLGRVEPPHLQPERDVALDGEVREQRVALEHHPEAALLTREGVDAPPVEQDLAVGERQQPRQAVERGGLAAPGRPEQGDELARPNGQVQAAQRRQAGEAASHVVQFERFERAGRDRHRVSSFG
nr:hypothetical protein [Propioniciclava coleopterorum]